MIRERPSTVLDTALKPDNDRGLDDFLETSQSQLNLEDESIARLSHLIDYLRHPSRCARVLALHAHTHPTTGAHADISIYLSRAIPPISNISDSGDEGQAAVDHAVITKLFQLHDRFLESIDPDVESYCRLMDVTACSDVDSFRQAIEEHALPGSRLFYVTF